MIGLTPKMRQVYDFIAARLNENGVAPTFQEIGAAIGLAPKSKARVSEILAALEQRGHIRRLPNCARAIELVAENPPMDPTADVRLNSEIFLLTRRYAREHDISIETAANELLRSALEAA